MIFPVAVRHWVNSSSGNPAYEPWSYLVKLLLVERAAKDWSSLQNSCKTNNDQWPSLFRCLNNWSLSTQLIQPCAVITSTVGRRLISCPILFLRLLKLNPPNIDLKKTGLRQLKTLFQKLFVPLVTTKIKEGWVDHCWIYQQKKGLEECLVRITSYFHLFPSLSSYGTTGTSLLIMGTSEDKE